MNRNPFCPKYDACLDHAVYSGKKLDCRGCQFVNDESGSHGSLDDMPGCIALLHVIFQTDTGKLIGKFKGSCKEADSYSKKIKRLGAIRTSGSRLNVF